MVVTPHEPLLLIATADEVETSWLLFEEIAEVLRSHVIRTLGHLLFPNHPGSDLAHHRRHLRIVDRWRVAGLKAKVDRSPHRRSDPGHDLPNTGGELPSHVRTERAQRSP